MTEMNKRYSELYEWWSNPSNKHCWFDATEFDDENISNLFGELIQIDWISQIDLEDEIWLYDLKVISSVNFLDAIKLSLSFSNV